MMTDPDLVGDSVPRAQSHIKLREHTYVVNGVDASDHIFQSIAQSHQFYESELLYATRRLISPGDLVVDVGANIGNHALFWAGECGAQVLAIEPAPIIFSALRANVEANNLEQRIYVRHYGLGRARGLAEFPDVDLSNTGRTRLIAGATGPLIIRPLHDLPEVAATTVRLLKVDVEGMELDVLEGARPTLERDHPAILVECLDDAAFESVRCFLANFSYSMLDCFNASPTYLFIARDWLYPADFSRTEHMGEIVGRLARASVLQRNHFNALNRRLS